MHVSRHRVAPGAGLIAGIVLLGLGGCGFKEMMGPQKLQQDEFSLQTNRPLVLPPSYDLKPPEPGKPDQGPSAEARAQQTLYGPSSGEAAAPRETSPGESALLKRAGAAQADPDIRQQVNAETAPVADRSAGMTDRVLDWKAPPTSADQDTTPEDASSTESAPAPSDGEDGGFVGGAGLPDYIPPPDETQ